MLAGCLDASVYSHLLVIWCVAVLAVLAVLMCQYKFFPCVVMWLCRLC
jgi:hypothetical protein